METRKVVVYEWKKEKEKTCFKKKVRVREGIFHQFGVDYEELEMGSGNYTTAIVEMPDGEIKNIPVGLVVFKS